MQFLAVAGLPVGPAPQGPLLKTCLNGKYSRLYRKLFREEQECGVPGPASYFTRRGDGIPVPALHKFMQGYNNLFKLNIPSKTLTNSFLVMNRQIWTNQKMHLSTTNSEEQASALCGLWWGWEHHAPPVWVCTVLWTYVGAGWGGNHCLNKAGLPNSTNIPDSCAQCNIQYIRWSGSTAAHRSDHGMVSRNQKGFNISKIQKMHR
jgi:hypothetical protein